MSPALKIFLGICALFLSLSLASGVVYAQASSPDPTPAATTAPSVTAPSPAPAAALSDPGCQVDAKGTPLNSKCFDYIINGQTTMFGSVGQALICGFGGLSVVGKCLAYGQRGSSIVPLVFNNIPDGGALGSMGSIMVAMYSQPPTSSQLYLASLGQNIGLLPKPAYAQVGGSGSNIIAPIFKLWQVSRNLTYILFVFIFIAVGFMIMFRQKINPQTIISIQAALPGMILGLILITFSYFIAALLIDLMFVCMKLATELFISAHVNNAIGSDAQLRNLAANSSLLQLFGSTTGGLGTVFSGVQGQLNASLGFGAGVATPAALGAIIGAVLFNIPGAIAGGLIGASAQFLIPVLVIIVLLLALVFQVFRLLFLLIAAYIQLLVYCITGPFYILIGSIPGRGATTTKWWRGILANALIFPAVFVAFLFAGVILGTEANFNSTVPLFGGANSNFIKALLAYGIILGSPAIPGMVKQALDIKDSTPLVPMAISGITGSTQTAQAGYNRFWRGPLDNRGRALNPGPIRKALETRFPGLRGRI